MRVPDVVFPLLATAALVAPAGAGEPPPDSFSHCGTIRTWNILGPFAHPFGGVVGEEEMRHDYMTDGRVGELDFHWRPGATIDTDFGGCAASLGLDDHPGDLNPGGVPTVFAWTSDSGFVDFAEVFGPGLDVFMAYVQVYVIAEREREVFIGSSNSGSIQIFLDCEEVGAPQTNVDEPTECEDPRFPNHEIAELRLQVGVHNLVLKVFQRQGENFALRFQNEFGNPITRGLETHLEADPPACSTKGFRRGDADGDGDLRLTDGVYVLDHLFRGGKAPSCDDAADADDSGAHEIADAIYLFNHLFRGGPEPPPPFRCCGRDSTLDPLGCAAGTAACQ